MATSYIARTLITKANTNFLLPSILSRSFTSYTSSVLLLRSLVSLTESRSAFSTTAPSALGLRCFSTRQTTPSLKDPSPNGNNRPPWLQKNLLEGLDLEHWLIVVEKPEGDPTRDEIIAQYIDLVASVVGSKEEARQRIYSVSTIHYFAIGVKASEELSYKFKEFPNVRSIHPDSYLYIREKDYGGEPFINGEAVPYDPKYHEEWVQNAFKCDYERRRASLQNLDFQAQADNCGPNISACQFASPNVPNSPNAGGMPRSFLPSR